MVWEPRMNDWQRDRPEHSSPLFQHRLLRNTAVEEEWIWWVRHLKMSGGLKFFKVDLRKITDIDFFTCPS